MEKINLLSDMLLRKKRFILLIGCCALFAIAIYLLNSKTFSSTMRVSGASVLEVGDWASVARVLSEDKHLTNREISDFFLDEYAQYVVRYIESEDFRASQAQKNIRIVATVRTDRVKNKKILTLKATTSVEELAIDEYLTGFYSESLAQFLDKSLKISLLILEEKAQNELLLADALRQSKRKYFEAALQLAKKTNYQQKINIFQTPSWVGEEFAFLIGEKNLRLALDALQTEGINFVSYYQVLAKIEKIKEFRKEGVSGSIFSITEAPSLPKNLSVHLFIYIFISIMIGTLLGILSIYYEKKYRLFSVLNDKE